MINRIVDAALGNRMLVLILIAGLVAAGLLSMQRLPFDADPDISPLQVLVTTQAPGLAPLDVERSITTPIELALQGLPGMTSYRSISRYGLSVIYVKFADGGDILTDRTLVAQRLSQTALPAEAGTPRLGPLSDGLSEIYQFKVEGKNYSLMQLRSILDWQVAPQLKLVPGITEVNVNGGELKTYEVRVSENALTHFGLSIEDIYNAVAQNNRAVGGATIARNGEQAVVRGEGLLQSIGDIGNIVLRTAAGGAPLYVKDVAEVVEAPMPRLGAVTSQGDGQAVVGVALMTLGENTRVVAQRLTTAVQQINKTLPPGVSIVPYYNRADLIDRVLQTVAHNLAEGAFLVIVVLLLLLGNFRAAVIVALAIPLSMLAAVTAMYFTGLSGNLMSLGAIDFGLLVDGAVVMIENIVRRRAEAPSLPVEQVVREAAHDVARPVAFAVAIITLIYLPILSLQGVEGKMFRPMALTVMFALVASLALTLTLMPVLASFFLRKPVAERDSRIIGVARSGYAPVLARTMRHPGHHDPGSDRDAGRCARDRLPSRCGVPASPGGRRAHRHHHQAARHLARIRHRHPDHGGEDAEEIPRGPDRRHARWQFGDPDRPDGGRAKRHLHHSQAEIGMAHGADRGRADRSVQARLWIRACPALRKAGRNRSRCAWTTSCRV